MEPRGNGNRCFTDGACRGNGRASATAGIGVFFGDGDPRNVGERIDSCDASVPVTNQQAELAAFLRALDIFSSANARSVEVVVDSDFVKQCVERYIPTWVKNGFRKADGSPVKNQPIMRAIAERLCRFDRVTVTRVRGHAGVYGNEQADRLATAAISKGSGAPPMESKKRKRQAPGGPPEKKNKVG